MMYSVLILLLLIPFNVFAQGTPATITLSVDNNNPTPGGEITLTATVTSGSVSSISFYYGTTPGSYPKFLGLSTSAPYTYTWNGVPAGTYYFIAYPGYGGSGGGSVNGPIDLFGSTVYGTSYPNPASNPVFGEAEKGTWLPGDNQMCNTTPPSTTPVWPYNGTNPVDGSCEWTNSGTPPASAGPTSPPLVNNNLSTVDGLDDVMHTLSDFDVFAQGFLNQDLGTINSTFDNWYPQAAAWIAPQCGSSCAPDPTTGDYSCTDTTCNASAPGRLLSLYDPVGYPGVGSNNNTVLVDKFLDMNNAISGWLDNSYTPPNATSAQVWCVPSESDLSANAPGEYKYIKNSTPPTTCPDGTACPAVCPPNNSSPATCPANVSCQIGRCSDNSICSFWGDLAHINACLNYNANQANNNYQACLNVLTNQCPASIAPNSPCDPAILGRSLAGPNPGWDSSNANNDNCDPTQTGFAQWVLNSSNLFNSENPKFALRYAFTNDVYTRAIHMENITAAADTALHNFLTPCGGECGVTDPTCSLGGPAAQLIYASTQGSPSVTLPNSVIYGWVDKTLANGQTLSGTVAGAGGYAHLVKVTAYSAGRNAGGPAGVQPKLPWVRAYITWELAGLAFAGIPIPYLNYALENKDGDVYVSIQRWDQDHTNGVTFPNGHNLWQMLFHNPMSGGTPSGNNPLSGCTSSAGYGFGLLPQTIQGFNFLPTIGEQLSPADVASLQNAFMLNDKGDGTVDPYASPTLGGQYQNCISMADTLLSYGMESHACARYVAASSPTCSNNNPSSCYSGKGDHDYSILFEDCNNIDGGSPPRSSP